MSDFVGEKEDREALKKIHRILSTQRVTLNFQETPFLDVVNFLRDITGLNIVVSKKARKLVEEEDLKVSIRLKDILLKNAIKLILASTHSDLAFGVRHGVLLIGMKEEFKKKTCYLGIYLVDDIIHVPPDFPAPKLSLEGLKP
jgi:type II secretory pathway component HofQ